MDIEAIERQIQRDAGVLPPVETLGMSPHVATLGSLQPGVPHYDDDSDRQPRGRRLLIFKSPKGKQ